MIAGTFRPRWKKGLRGPQPMCCQQWDVFLWRNLEIHGTQSSQKGSLRLTLYMS